MDNQPRLRQIEQAQSRPADPWHISRYTSQQESVMSKLSKMTAQEIIMNPFEVGVMTDHKSRALASSQGIIIDTSYDEHVSFGFIPPIEGEKPLAIVNGDYGSALFEKSNRALAHYIYMYLKVSSDCSDGCKLENLYVPPQSIVSVAKKLSANAKKFKLLPHWWESTVWVRAYYGTNAIYTSPLNELVRREDEERGFWFPDITTVGNAKRYARLWTGDPEAKVLNVLDPSHKKRGSVISHNGKEKDNGQTENM